MLAGGKGTMAAGGKGTMAAGGEDTMAAARVGSGATVRSGVFAGCRLAERCGEVSRAWITVTRAPGPESAGSENP